MARNHPVTGPYPDGDSRNITLTPSDTSIEPERTGPREPNPDDPRARADRVAERKDRDQRDDVPGTPLTDLPTHTLHAHRIETSQTSSVRGGPGAAGRAAPQSSDIGLGNVSAAQARATLGMAGKSAPARASADSARPLAKD